MLYQFLAPCSLFLVPYSSSNSPSVTGRNFLTKMPASIFPTVINKLIQFQFQQFPLSPLLLYITTITTFIQSYKLTTSVNAMLRIFHIQAITTHLYFLLFTSNYINSPWFTIIQVSHSTFHLLTNNIIL